MTKLINDIGKSKLICKLQFILLAIAIYPIIEEGRDITPILLGIISGGFIMLLTRLKVNDE